MKKDEIVSQVKNIISFYPSVKLTLRQIYYQLVAKYNLENNANNYKYLSKILVEARKYCLIDYESLEDNTRTFHHSFRINETIVKKEVDDIVSYLLERTFAFLDLLFKMNCV
jgi:hypothetical protein